MRIHLLPIAFLASIISLNAQFRIVTCGPGYTLQTYYQLGNEESVSLEHNAWDIAFTAQGLQDAGIFLNEAAGSEGTELELYLAPTTDFAVNIEEDQLEARLFNDESNWTDAGAFNQIRDEANPLDYGWGQYNPALQSVQGNSIFVIKLRNGVFKKLEISNLDGTTYNFRYADLDGSNEQTHAINKADYPNSGLIHWSFTSDSVVDFVPATKDWDLVFTRYSTPLDDGEGGTINYLLTGTLSGLDVEVAQADGVNPDEVAFGDYQAELSADLDVIGYDWKAFDFQTLSWQLPPDRAYFVKTANGEVWKLVFIDFEGSSTGDIVFQETNLGVVNTVDHTVFEDFNVFPNPAQDVATLSLTLRESGPLQLALFNAMGQQVWSFAENCPSGFQVLDIPVQNLSAGTYWLNLQSSGASPITHPLIVTH